MEFKEILISEIKDNFIQPEGRTTEMVLKNLKKSIADIGLLEPVTVRREAKGYRMINGHRRTACYKAMGKDTIPAVIVDVNSKEGFVACNSSSKPLHRRDWVGMFLKGAKPPTSIMNQMIEITDKLGKDFLIVVRDNLKTGTSVICGMIFMAELLDLKSKADIKRFIYWGFKHKHSHLIKTLIRTVRVEPKGTVGALILKSFNADEKLEVTIK